MEPGLGVALIAIGAAAGLAATFLLRTHVPWTVQAIVLACSGASVGAGGLLVQETSVNSVNWALTLILSAVLIPLHVWVVFGRPGRGVTS